MITTIMITTIIIVVIIKTYIVKKIYLIFIIIIIIAIIVIIINCNDRGNAKALQVLVQITVMRGVSTIFTVITMFNSIIITLLIIVIV